MKKSLWPALLSSSLVAVGCASIAVTGEAIGTETIRYGHRVAIMSLPAAPVLVTEKALAVVGPRAFGYDIDFTSVHPRGAP